MNHLNVEVISRKEISYNSYLQRTYTISFFKNQFLFLIFFIALYLFFSQTLLSQENSSTHQTETYHRDYTFVFGFNYDVLNSSENFRTLIKIYSDTYYRKLAFKLEDSKTKSIIQFTWTFLGKWLTFLLPHEFGHWLRTNQVGGSFTFKQFAPPGIISDLKFHKNATIEDQSLALIGGFEANYLTARDVQLDFYRYGGLYNDEYGMAFANRIMYPLYAFLFAPQNPKDNQTWVRSGGDPVNFTKLVWEMGNRDVFIKKYNPFLWEQVNRELFPLSNQVVNPKLVQFYNNAALASVLWNLVDWNIYRQAHSFFGEQIEGKRPWLFGSENIKWGYGTLFNTSVLGVELYLYNYLKFKNNFFSFYFKSGFPYKNNGMGLIISDIVTFKNLSLDFQLDFWKQEFYGNGFAIVPIFRYKIQEELSFIAQIGYKTKGYLLGKTLEENGIGFIGVKYYLLN